MIAEPASPIEGAELAELLAELAPADLELWRGMGPAVPRYSPMPRAGARHELAACEAVGVMLGTPLTPWERWFARIATERRLDDPSRYRFPLMLLTVPRQAGKTTIVRIVLLVRMIVGESRRSFYTAQTGKDALQRWTDLTEMIARPSCPLGPLVKVRRAVGSAALVVTPTASRLSPFAPTPESLHGYTPHDVAIDELFAFDDEEGDALLGAIVPAQQTIRDRQLLMLSTAGTRLSTFLRRQVTVGRATILGRPLSLPNGEPALPSEDLGYIEHSLRDGADPYDEAEWHFHPALGYTITMDDLRQAARSLPRGEWLRAYCNRWTEDSDPLFDMVRYDTLNAGELPAPTLAECSVGFGTAVDRSRVAAVAAWELADGAIGVKILTAGPDVAGFPAYLAELQQTAEIRPAVLIGDDGGLNRSTIELLRLTLPEYRHPTTTNPREWQLASAGLHAAIEDGRLRHDGDRTLRAAVSAALSRPMGESWALSHKSPPEATALAAAIHGLARRDTPAEPEIRF